MDIFALEIDESFAAIYPKIIEKGFSRIPVYRDNIDQIEGVLFVKDLLPHINKEEFDWKTLLREPFFVPENKKIDNLLKDFQSMKSHLAIVVDEYGGTSGLVSLKILSKKLWAISVMNLMVTTSIILKLMIKIIFLKEKQISRIFIE